MIQMNGAEMDSTNTSSFGDVKNYKSAGLYQYNEIADIVSGKIILKFNLAHSFDFKNAVVQIVGFKKAKTYEVNTLHTAKPWNGNTGGILFIKSSDSIILNANIDVSSKGFIGGKRFYSTKYYCNRFSYFYDSVNNEGAKKGEGIGYLSKAKKFGRGKWTNGGGGGNDINSGGAGGGGNGGVGGRGGYQYLGALALSDCSIADRTINSDIGGIGGLALSRDVTRVYLGGGGGCGHGDGGSNTEGGNGGGLVFFKQ
jgi:hypothetical protein